MLLHAAAHSAAACWCACPLASLRAGDTVTHLPCKHCFHKDCIGQWLGTYSKHCPVCKAEVTAAT